MEKVGAATDGGEGGGGEGGGEGGSGKGGGDGGRGDGGGDKGGDGGGDTVRSHLLRSRSHRWRHGLLDGGLNERVVHRGRLETGVEVHDAGGGGIGGDGEGGRGEGGGGEGMRG